MLQLTFQRQKLNRANDSNLISTKSPAKIFLKVIVLYMAMEVASAYHDINQVKSERFLQAQTAAAPLQCNITQYLVSGVCRVCPTGCATCLSPQGSCERCPLAPTSRPTLYPASPTNLTTAICSANLGLCTFLDPFCLGNCTLNATDTHCNMCLKGTMSLPFIPDNSSQALTTNTSNTANITPPTNAPPSGTTSNSSSNTSSSNQTIFRCQPCPFDGCAACNINSTTSKPQCLECERKFILQVDSTGNQRCARDPQVGCPDFCICNNTSMPSLCTSCNQTAKMMVKEPGLSNFSQCIDNTLADPNIPCGPNCTLCNTLTGVCLVCAQSFSVVYNNITFTYGCQSTCGAGCLGCNQTTRNCDQCDSMNNFTAYKTSSGLQRCINPSTLCQPECTNCNTTGLSSVPAVLTGVCNSCIPGLFFNSTNKMCQKCDPLCSLCQDSTGNCTQCTLPTNTLYLPRSTQKFVCTDRKCSPACTNCDVFNGMTNFSQPICLACNDGFFVSSATKDCAVCPLNCALCDKTGTCTKCKSGFTLLTAQNQCVTGASSASCNVPYCDTCDASNSSNCIACTSGYIQNGTQCQCGITLTFKGQGYASDWSSVQVQWNGQLKPYTSMNVTNQTDPTKTCQLLLLNSSLTDFQFNAYPHSCYMNYDQDLKVTTFLMVLNNTYLPRTIISQISFSLKNITSPVCPTILTNATFLNVSLTTPDLVTPQVLLDMPSNSVPLGSASFKIAAFRTTGLFGKPATFAWTVKSLTPAEPQKLTDFTTIVTGSQAEIDLNSTQITEFQGKTVTLSLNVTNFLGSSNSTSVTLLFLTYEGLIWRTVPDNIVVDPSQDFQIQASLGITAQNMTQDIINKFSRLMINCTIMARNITTVKFQNVSQLPQCLIPAGLIKSGSEYVVGLVGYDPVQEYKQSIFKNITVSLVKPPLTASINGGDQTIDPSKDVSLSVTGTQLTNNLTYTWTCIDPNKGVNCVSKTNDKIFLQGQQSILIKANLLNSNYTYKILFSVSDPNDATRSASSTISITTIGAAQVQLNVQILGQASTQSNYFNIYEQQVFYLSIFDNNNNQIIDTSKYKKIWSIADSNSNNFTDYILNNDALTIKPGKLQPNNIYFVCVLVSYNVTNGYGRSCQNYQSLGLPTNFKFTISPNTGIAYSTPFTFSCQASSTLTVQYTYEFGIASQSLAPNSTTQIVTVYVPFEVGSSQNQKQYALNPPPPGQTLVLCYAKLTSLSGQIYYMFGNVTVTKPTLNSTQIANSIKTTSLDTLNSVYTQSQMISSAGATLDQSTQKIVATTLLSGISNLTNALTAPSTSSSSSSSGSSSSSSDGSSSSSTPLSTASTLTLAQSLGPITSLYALNPSIFSSSDKDKLKSVLQNIVGSTSTDSSYYASTGSSSGSASSLTSTSSSQNQAVLGASSSSNQSNPSDTTNVVTKYDSTTSTAILKVFDDILTAESKSNTSDNSLMQQAYVGVKKILSGSLSGSDTNFTYSSSQMNAQAVRFQSGSGASSANQTLSITDPCNSTGTTKVQVGMPSTDVCGGGTCQMNMVSLKSSPINATSANQGSIIASTISISFETSSQTSGDTSSLTVSKIKVNNLTSPISIQMAMNTSAIQNGTKQRCVYFDQLTNQLSDSGVITQVNQTTGIVTCNVYHLTDFSIESFDPTVAARQRMNSNLYKYQASQSIPMAQTFPVPITLCLSLITIGLIVFGIKIDQKDEESLQNNKQAPITRLRDVLYFNRLENANLFMIHDDKNLNDSQRNLKAKGNNESSLEISQNDIDQFGNRVSVLNSSQSIQMKKQISKGLVIKLAIKNQHRLLQIISLYENQIPRAVKALEFGTSLFVLLLFAALYSSSDSISISQAIISSFIGSILQKVVLLIANLFVRRSQKKILKKEEEDENQDTQPDNMDEIIGQMATFKSKRTQSEMISLIFGVIFMALVIAVSLFVSFMIAQSIDNSDNLQFVINFVMALILDLFILEIIMVSIGGLLTHKLGQSPDAFGPIRNFMLRITPKALRIAILPQNLSSNLDHYKQNQQLESEKQQQQQQQQQQQLSQHQLMQLQYQRQMQQQQMMMAMQQQQQMDQMAALQQQQQRQSQAIN